VSTFNLGPINADNVQVGDHNVQVNTTDLFQSLDAGVQRHRARVPDPTGAARALTDLRRECAAQPPDPARVQQAAGALGKATAGAPGIRDDIDALLARVLHPGTRPRR
jgi:hypothetical protein